MNSDTITVLDYDHRLELYLDFSGAIKGLDVMVVYTYLFGEISRLDTPVFKFRDGGTYTLLEQTPVNSTKSKVVQNIIYRKLPGSSEPIVELRRVNEPTGDIFLLQAFDATDLPQVFDFHGKFSDFGGSF